MPKVSGGESWGGMEGSDEEVPTPRLMTGMQHGACGFPLIQVGVETKWIAYTPEQIEARASQGDPLEGEGYNAQVEIWQCSPGCCRYERTR